MAKQQIIEIGTGYTSIPANVGAATEIVIEELTHSMLKQGVNVQIVDISDTNRAATDLPITEVRVPFFITNKTFSGLGVAHKIKRVAYSLALARTLRRIIKSAKSPITLHFHNQYNLYFFLKTTPKRLLSNVTIGYTVHSHVWFGQWEHIKNTIKRRYFQEVYCCQHAHHVYTLNPIVTEMLTSNCKVPAEHVTCVINGVNTDRYRPLHGNDERVETLRGNLGLSRQNHIALQVGSVCERKNQLGTLRLLTPIMQRHPELHFCYCGAVIDTEYAQNITTEAIHQGLSDRIHYLGEIAPGEQLNAVYNLADCTFMNSLSEAFCLVVFESLAAGTPAFVNPCIIDSQPVFKGRSGQGVLPIGDDFDNAIEQLLSNDSYRNSLGLKGREFLQANYSWDIAAQQYLRAFSR